MTCSDNAPPDDGGDDNQTLVDFADKDCKALAAVRRNPPVRRWQTFLQLPFKAIGYLFFLPCWPMHMTISEIRQVRETFAPNPNRKPWQIGLMPFFFINWLLWHLHRHIRSLDLDANDGKHAAFIIGEIWKRTFAGNGEFFPCYDELRPRDYAQFLTRDKTFFLARNGDVFTTEMRETLYFTLILNHRGNRFIRLLYSWACGIVDEQLVDLGKAISLARFFTENRNLRLAQIRNVRRGALERLETYAENMLRLALDSGDTQTAAHWNDVICRVRELKGFRPVLGSLKSLGTLSQKVKYLADHFNAAGKRTYVLYRAQETDRLPSTADKPPARQATKKKPPREIKNLGRFKVAVFDKHYVITDIRQKTKRPYRITISSNAGSIVRQLILNHATGTDQTHVSDSSWKGAFQSGRGDASRFKGDQIFILPRWDAEKGHFLPKQKSNRWRLWTDDELSLTNQQRLERFIEAHPNGLPR